MKHTYHHVFRDRRTTATLTIEPGRVACQWSGKQSRLVLAEYLQWRDRCMADYAKATGLRMLVVTL